MAPRLKKRTLFFLLLFVVAGLAPTALDRLREPPILMYHRIGYPQEEPGIFVTTRTFERQMEFLKMHHTKVLSLSDLIKKIKAGERLPLNCVVITFDDGTLDNFKNAYPVLKKMDFPATIFMITDNIGKEEWLSDEDLRILDASGIEIGAHTVHHAFLPKISLNGDVQNEIGESKRQLEEILGHPVTLFSYPAGGVTPQIAEIVQKAGYEGAVTTNYGRTRNHVYALHRIKVSEAQGNLFNFWLKTSGFYHLGKKRVEASGAYE